MAHCKVAARCKEPHSTSTLIKYVGLVVDKHSGVECTIYVVVTAYALLLFRLDPSF